MKVLAFDPGYERLGVAVLERDKAARNGTKLVMSDCVRTSAKDSFHLRLKQLGNAAEQLIAEYAPDAVALEKVYFEKNAKTAMGIAEVRGMLAYIAASHDIPICEYTPLEVKTAVTGYGRSDKAAIALMLPRLIDLPATKKRLDDEMDAIAVALTCLATVKQKRKASP